MRTAEKYVFQDDERARFVAEFWRGKVFLHLTIRQWGMDTLREIRVKWPGIKVILKAIGFNVIYAYNLERFAKQWTRFMAHFGFTEVRRKNGLVLMEVKNG